MLKVLNNILLKTSMLCFDGDTIFWYEREFRDFGRSRDGDARRLCVQIWQLTASQVS